MVSLLNAICFENLANYYYWLQNPSKPMFLINTKKEGVEGEDKNFSDLNVCLNYVHCLKKKKGKGT